MMALNKLSLVYLKNISHFRFKIITDFDNEIIYYIFFLIINPIIIFKSNYQFQFNNLKKQLDHVKPSILCANIAGPP